MPQIELGTAFLHGCYQGRACLPDCGNILQIDVPLLARPDFAKVDVRLAIAPVAVTLVMAVQPCLHRLPGGLLQAGIQGGIHPVAVGVGLFAVLLIQFVSGHLGCIGRIQFYRERVQVSRYRGHQRGLIPRLVKIPQLLHAGQYVIAPDQCPFRVGQRVEG